MSYAETFQIEAPAEKVFDALLDEEMLTRWLAEHALVEPRVGGSFRFWGRDVIWCPSQGDASGEISSLDRPRTLEIVWRWQGHASRVSFQINDKGPCSELAIEQQFETFDPGPNGPGPDMAGCHWRIAVGNLTSVLAKGRASLRPDYAASASESNPRVDLEIEIETPPERVFRALLDPEQVKLWMQIAAPEIDTGEERYSFGWRRGEPAVEVGPTRILEIIPNRLLVHDWQSVDEPAGEVRWELFPSPGGTRLRLIHKQSRDISHALGWSDALFGIRRLLQGDA